MHAETGSASRERNFTVRLQFPHAVNAAWLENQAMRIEDSLVRECSADVLGPSVSANFADNGFELDLTVEADSLSEAYDKLGRVLSVVERVAGIKLDPTDEVRSTLVSQPQGPHAPAVLG